MNTKGDSFVWIRIEYRDRESEFCSEAVICLLSGLQNFTRVEWSWTLILVWYSTWWCGIRNFSTPRPHCTLMLLVLSFFIAWFGCFKYLFCDVQTRHQDWRQLEPSGWVIDMLGVPKQPGAEWELDQWVFVILEGWLYLSNRVACFFCITFRTVFGEMLAYFLNSFCMR